MVKINKKVGLIFVIVFLAVIIFGAIKFREIRNKAEVSSLKNRNLSSEKIISVKLVINDSKDEHKFESKISSNSTVLDLLKKDSQDNGFSLNYKDTSAGVFVDEIYGVKNDTKGGKYWMYKINGKFANVGASSYVILDGDIIEWVFSDGSELNK